VVSVEQTSNQIQGIKMRYSRMFIPTVKETPSDAETASHKLMIRAGLMRKVASGTYSYLPLGWRSLLKVISIVREEMNKAGAQPYCRRGLYDNGGRRDKIV
jgi:prolyl-tRNA synthetase